MRDSGVAVGVLPIAATAFERIAADHGPCELERGRIVRLMPSTMPSGRSTTNIAMHLGTWARRRRCGRMFINLGVVTRRNPDTVRGAAVAFASHKRVPRTRLSPGFARVPPELSVDILRPEQGWGKMIEKAAEYLRMGVDRVWIVDPKKRRVCVFRPDDEPQVLDAGDLILDADILPGFRCRVRDFFA